MFQKAYDLALGWAGHRHAPRYLAGLSAAEAIFFPIPPDVMLMPMCLANMRRAFYYAFICTAASVIGGFVGYAIGWSGSEPLAEWLQGSPYAAGYTEAVTAFDRFGVWILLVAGFSPIPYKVFTITAGLLLMPLPQFMVGAIIGRSARFFLVAGVLRLGGEHMADRIRPLVDWVGWAMVVLLVAALGWWFLVH